MPAQIEQVNGHTEKNSALTGRETQSNRSLPSPIPNHIGIIMDGNGRWATERGLPRIAGHHAGVENVRRILKQSAEYGIKALTIYAFSTENWQRPLDEVNGLMRLLGLTIQRELNDLHKNGVRILHSGQLEGINHHLQTQIRRAIDVTQHNDRVVLNVAFNYGGRAEILDAVRHALAAGVNPNELTEEIFSQYMYTSGLPDPDLIIRTGGEWRLSNFLIWQAAYAEYYTTPTYWPDFDETELDKALAEYARRERRFGRVLEKQKP